MLNLRLFARAALVALMAACVAGPLKAQEELAPLRETHGDWQVRCETATGQCFMTQLHKNPSGEPDVIFTVIRPRGLTGPDGAPISALAEIAVPLGVYLPQGLGVRVDQGVTRGAEYQRCIPSGCLVRAPVSQEMLTSLKGGLTAFVVILREPSEPVEVPISLRGFTAAFESL